MASIQKIREIGGIINSTDLNYNFKRIQEDLQLAVEGVIFDEDYSHVGTIAERNAIPEERLITGLWVSVAETGYVYEYTKRKDLTISLPKRVFGPGSFDLPEVPYVIDGDSGSGVLIDACYVCSVNDKQEDWKYLSATTGIEYDDGDWAVYKKPLTNSPGHWEKVPKWIKIMDINSILETGFIGNPADLHTLTKVSLVAAINEAYDGIGNVSTLGTIDKTNTVAAINEVNSKIGNLSNLSTTAKDVLVNSINEVVGNVGNVSSLTTTNKTSLVVALNELDAEHGDLTTLKTVAKMSFVGAINEIHDDLGTLTSLNTTTKTSAVAAINEVSGRTGALTSLNTISKTNLVSALNEVNTKVGNVTSLTTTAKDNTVNAINELKILADSLRGALIILGKIDLNTSEVTQSALTTMALAIKGGTVLQTGWALVDKEQHDWIWNGTTWEDIEQPNVYPAQNDSLGTVMGSASGDISVTNGAMTVLSSANSLKLGGQLPAYYATASSVAAKANTSAVLTKTNTTSYVPTADYHPATKGYVDAVSGGASWGSIMNNIQDQEDLITLLGDYSLKTTVLTRTNTTAYSPTSDYHPATKLYVDTVFENNANLWGQIGGSILDQQDLQDQFTTKQSVLTAWNTENLVISATQPATPATGFIVWVDINN